MSVVDAIYVLVPIVSAIGTFVSLSRKLVSKDDLNQVIDKLNEFTDRVIDLEKRVAILEYRADNDK